MLKKLLRLGTVFLFVLLSFSLCINFSSYAKTKKKKKINQVTLKIDGNIEYDTEIGNESIEIIEDDPKYDVKSFEFNNVGFRWTLEDVPELSIELEATDGYYFNIDKSNNIKLPRNVQYKSARRTDNATVLNLVVTLPSLATQIGEIEHSEISDDGKITWDTVRGASTFEVKFRRNISLLGGIQRVRGNELDVSEYMTREGNYQYFIRAINDIDSSITSDWYVSDNIYVDKEQANKFKAKKEQKDSLGKFMKNTNGDWYYMNADGSYLYSDWKKINDDWYYFGANGYMVKGWYQLGEEWYYLDTIDGHMWKNQVTPDGYQLTIVGTWAKNIPRVIVQ